MGIQQHLLGGITYQPGSLAYPTAGTFTFTVPEGVYNLNYEIVSGGGAGGLSVLSGDRGIGSGGGSGGVLTGSVAVVPLSTVSVVVGAGGPAAVTYGAAPDGSASSINAGSLISVSPGGGGHGPLGDNGAAYAGAAGSPNGVPGQNIYTNQTLYRNSGFSNNGGVNSTGVGSGGRGSSGNGAVSALPGGTGRVTLSW